MKRREKFDWKEAIHDYRMFEPYVAQADGRNPRDLTDLGWRLLIAWDRLCQWPLNMLCAYWGHNTVHEYQAGPDSGWESWHCTRCGVGGSHTYY